MCAGQGDTLEADKLIVHNADWFVVTGSFGFWKHAEIPWREGVQHGQCKGRVGGGSLPRRGPRLRQRLHAVRLLIPAETRSLGAYSTAHAQATAVELM